MQFLRWMLKIVNLMIFNLMDNFACWLTNVQLNLLTLSVCKIVCKSYVRQNEIERKTICFTKYNIVKCLLWKGRKICIALSESNSQPLESCQGFSFPSDRFLAETLPLQYFRKPLKRFFIVAFFIIFFHLCSIFAASLIFICNFTHLKKIYGYNWLQFWS